MNKAVKTVSGPVQPRDITVIGPMLQAMQQVAVHIRSGYYPSPTVPMQVFATTGTVSVPLVIGTPISIMSTLPP